MNKTIGQGLLFAAVAALAIFSGPPASAETSSVLRRADVSAFIGYENFRAATLSPDGRYIAGILRDKDGDLLIVHDRTTKSTKPIQRARADQSLELTFVQFKGSDQLVFGLQQKFEIVQGSSTARRTATKSEDEGFGFVTRVYASKTDGTDVRSLYDPSSEQGFPRWVNASIADILPSDPDHVLMRTPSTRGTQLRKVNVRTGKFEVIDTGSSSTGTWTLDSNLKPVLRQDFVSAGKGRVWYRKDASGKWIEMARHMGDETANGAPDFTGLGRGPRPGTALVSARPNGRDTNGVYVFEATTGTYAEPVFEHSLFDVGAIMRDPMTDSIAGACYEGFKWECVPSDPTFAAHWAGLKEALGPDYSVSISGGGDFNGSILVFADGPNDPGSYYVFDTQKLSLEFFQSVRQGVDPKLMPTSSVFDYTAQDGTEMWGYLWLPPGATRESRNLPMVVLPHGGPESRDIWGFDPLAGYWASQGYAVFQPHFRGGSGTGRKWVEAGHGQWGQLIQEDINDGTRAVVASGLADANRVCVAGWSHGGYVAFTASFRDTDIYKCSLAGAGVSDLRAMLQWVRKEQGGTQSVSYKYWNEAIGDHSQDAGKLDRFSANKNADNVGMPLLIVHGELDVTVPIEQSKMMAASLKKAGKPHEFIELKGMDHYLRRDQAEDWKLVLTKGKEFFDKHIGPGWSPPTQ